MLRRLKRAVLTAALSPGARDVIRERLTMLGARKLLRLEWTAVGLRRRGIAGDFAEFGLALGDAGIPLARRALRDGRPVQGHRR